MSDSREQFRPEDHPNDHFLLTTVVGSYPKPKWLDRARELYEHEHEHEHEHTAEDKGAVDKAGRSAAERRDEWPGLDDEAWAEARDDAARLTTEEHERAGVDAVTDGEMRREEMVEFFARRIAGYEFNGPVKVWGHNYFDKPSVVSTVEYDEPWLVEEFEFTASVATRPVKVPITGPYTLASWSFDEVYGSDEALANDLADLVNEEVHRLVDAGVRYVQIDEPALATTPDDHAIVGDCLDRIVADLPDDVRVGLHVCYGDYSRIYPEVLEFPVDELDLELCNGDYDQLDIFTDPPFAESDMDLALGVVDVHTEAVESVDEIERNIRRGLEVVPPERLTVSPDCGLKLLSREAAYGKMANMVEAARSVEAKLDAGEIAVGNATTVGE